MNNSEPSVYYMNSTAERRIQTFTLFLHFCVLPLSYPMVNYNSKIEIISFLIHEWKINEEPNIMLAVFHNHIKHAKSN